MNDHELHELLDDAANSFTPRPDIGRLAALLHQPRRARPVVYGLSVAAALVFAVGGVAAMSSGKAAVEIVPAGPEGSTTTVVDTLPDARTHLAVDPDDLFPEPTAPGTDPVVVVVDHVEPPSTAPPAVGREPLREPRPGHATTTTHVPPTTKAPAATAPPTTKAPAPVAPPPATEPATTTTHPATTTTTTTQPPTGFSANQTWGSCGDAPPYDEFYGTAAAGSTITVSSPYGSGSTTAGADGKWYIKVFFPTAPPYESFTVTVGSPHGTANFPFIHTP